jgi:hypothetical protein
LCPGSPYADHLGVEERHVPAVVAGYLIHPTAFGEVRLAFLEERPDVSGILEAPLILPASRALTISFERAQSSRTRRCGGLRATSGSLHPSCFSESCMTAPHG